MSVSFTTTKSVLSNAALGFTAIEAIYDLVAGDKARDLPGVVIDAIRGIIEVVMQRSQGLMTTDEAEERIAKFRRTIEDNDANARAIRDARFPQE